MKIRQSTLGNADACLRRMQYDLETPREVYHSGSVRAIGTGYHASLERHYRDRYEGAFQAISIEIYVGEGQVAFAREVELAGENFLWDEKFPDIESANDIIELMVRNYFEGEFYWPLDWDVVGVETPFEIPHRNITLSSNGIDLILQAPTLEIVGVDHKTTGKMWDQYKHTARKNNQASLCTYALKQMFPTAPGHRFVFDVMTYKGLFARRISDPQTGHMSAILDKAEQVAYLWDWHERSGVDLPANPASTLCSKRYCDFWSICPHGEALDSVPVSIATSIST